MLRERITHKCLVQIFPGRIGFETVLFSHHSITSSNIKEGNKEANQENFILKVIGVSHGD